MACLWMELVTGEGDFLVAPRRYVQGLPEICAEHGIPFIADEIQTGFCRTGTHGKVMRFLFPLVITAEELGEGLDVIEGVLGELAG